MSQHQPSPSNKPKGAGQDDETFTTDISETGEDGTTVREAEVREKDLSEVKPSSPGGGSGKDEK